MQPKTSGHTGPDPKKGDAEAKRKALRDKYLSSVSDLLKSLEAQPKAAYTTDDLTKLGVTLQTFGLNDPKFLESNAWLFTPMSSEINQLSRANDKEKREGPTHYSQAYLRENPFENHPTKMKDADESDYLFAKADLIRRYLDYIYGWCEGSVAPLVEISRWLQIRYI